MFADLPGRRSLAVPITLAAVACTESVVCTANIQPGVVVEVIHAQTRFPLADSAFVVAIDGAYADTLRPFESVEPGILLSRSGADERPGIYEVRVSRIGYRDWSEAGVTVVSDECHVLTVRVEAKLQPQ